MQSSLRWSRAARILPLSEDLGSTNGTLIWRNTHWQEVELDDLEDGDMLVIGKDAFRFSQGAGDRGEPMDARVQAQEM